MQTNILKEYTAQKEWIFPIQKSTRIVRDLIIYYTERYPRYNPINFGGYHISKAGATPIEEIAFTMANVITCVEEVVEIRDSNEKDALVLHALLPPVPSQPEPPEQKWAQRGAIEQIGLLRRHIASNVQLHLVSEFARLVFVAAVALYYGTR